MCNDKHNHHINEPSSYDWIAIGVGILVLVGVVLL